jgi:hypothetical protein
MVYSVAIRAVRLEMGRLRAPLSMARPV